MRKFQAVQFHQYEKALARIDELRRERDFYEHLFYTLAKAKLVAYEKGEFQRSIGEHKAPARVSRSLRGTGDDLREADMDVSVEGWSNGVQNSSGARHRKKKRKD